jgi:hypothetical protein
VGLCCAPNCAGRQCGPDGCGRGGACGNCSPCQTCNSESGQCQALPNGTPCGTQPGGGATRCCNGACPSPTCRPPGPITPLPPDCGQCGGCCASTFCEEDQNLKIVACRCESTIIFPGGPCGSDADCTAGAQAGLPACICGTCHAPPA